MGGDEGMRKLDEMFGDAVESSHSELFTVNPKQSYVSDDWIKADPGFWKTEGGSDARGKAGCDAAEKAHAVTFYSEANLQFTRAAPPGAGPFAFPRVPPSNRKRCL